MPTGHVQHLSWARIGEAGMEGIGALTLCARRQVLDMPRLPDDFYMSLMDWSAQNVLAVAIGAAVYLWDAATEQARPAALRPAPGTGAPPCRPDNAAAPLGGDHWLPRSPHM